MRPTKTRSQDELERPDSDSAVAAGEVEKPQGERAFELRRAPA
ncbi:hypothetical protein [Rhizobium leguminosarum]|nr:hypothetical protein [Rhizobium leguminosarum]